MQKKSKKTKAVTETTAPAPQAVPVLTEAEKIWNEIKFLEIQMFALPGQTVSHYCKPAVVEPSKLYLLTTASAVLPSLEAAVGPRYIVESADKYTVVSRAPASPFNK